MIKWFFMPFFLAFRLLPAYAVTLLRRAINNLDDGYALLCIYFYANVYKVSTRVLTLYTLHHYTAS